MKFAFPKETDADGGEPVGLLESHSDADRHLVRCIRLWMAGSEAQQSIWNTLAGFYGAAEGRRILRSFEAYLSNVAVSIDRKLSRHAPCCPCICRDEAILLMITKYAASGDSLSASIQAASLVREERIAPVVEAAKELGSLLSLTDLTASDRTPNLHLNTPASGTIH